VFSSANRAVPLEQVDLIRLAEFLDAARELIDDAVLPVHHPGEVDCGVGVDPHLLGGGGLVSDVGRGNQRFEGMQP